MEPFLLQVARRIADDHPHNTDRVLVVFNNNRSKRFFLKQFESLERPMFLPQVLTIDELVSRLGGLEIVPNEFLLFELYSIHTEIGGAERKYQSFEEFISFGDLMLGDFSEIDQYCVDARMIFDNLHQLKAIGEWDIENPGLNQFQQDYLNFYRSLYRYYAMLHERLLSQGKAYGGMAYREVAEHMADLAEPCPWQAVYFVGFNAMSECERRIIGEYVRRGLSHIVTDGDIYYMQPEQEAGYFLRKHEAEFPELKPQGASLFGQGKRSITVVECPENLLQCKYTGALLSEKLSAEPSESTERTAVVLADESLLMPVLNALPDMGRDYSVNISMGYAYADSAVYALTLKLLSLWRQCTAKGYYYTDVLEVCGDRHISALAGKGELRPTLEATLRRESRIRCTHADVQQLLPAELHFLFPEGKPDPQACLDMLRQMAAQMANADLGTLNRKEQQALGSLVEVLDNLAVLHASYPYITNTETLEKIYTRIAQRHQIALIGEPMSGLQILGMLETRNLDFGRVVLLSANEGVVPGGRGGNTLIPHELKLRFGLPTYVEKDNVYAYNFYRLLLRSEEVYLLYSSESDGMGKGEPSRFIRQVESELAPRFGIEVRHLTVGADTALYAGQAPRVGEKSPRVMQRLSAMASHGLSPTNFADFIECPLKYYYSRVLGVSESRTLEEDLDAAELGDCVHNVLEHIYKPLLGQPLRIADIKEASGRMPALLKAEFDRLYAHGRSTEGRNRFLYSVAEAQLQHLLRNELTLLEQGHTIQVDVTEDSIEPYPIATDAEGRPVYIKGKVDRVDWFDGLLRVIDYKTGSLEEKEITFADPMPGKWLQLMWYALLYCRRKGLQCNLVSGIYPLRNLRSDVRLAKWDGDPVITPDRLGEFEAMLREKVERLMDPSEAFAPTPSRTACRFCPVAAFCEVSVQ